MEIFYCSECRLRLTDVDLNQGNGARVENKVYCQVCASKAGIQNNPYPQPARKAQTGMNTRATRTRQTVVSPSGGKGIVIFMILMAFVLIGIVVALMVMPEKIKTVKNQVPQVNPTPVPTPKQVTPEPKPKPIVVSPTPQPLPNPIQKPTPTPKPTPPVTTTAKGEFKKLDPFTSERNWKFTNQRPEILEGGFLTITKFCEFRYIFRERFFEFKGSIQFNGPFKDSPAVNISFPSKMMNAGPNSFRASIFSDGTVQIKANDDQHHTNQLAKVNARFSDNKQFPFIIRANESGFSIVVNNKKIITNQAYTSDYNGGLFFQAASVKLGNGSITLGNMELSVNK